jgi:hypothetical protein
MKIGARVSQARGEAQASRIERLKERLLRERARELQNEMQRARRDGAAIESTRMLPRSWR